MISFSVGLSAIKLPLKWHGKPLELTMCSIHNSLKGEPRSFSPNKSAKHIYNIILSVFALLTSSTVVRLSHRMNEPADFLISVTDIRSTETNNLM